VFTHLSRRIPSIIRALLGRDLPGFGYDMQYRRFDAGPLVSGQLRRRVSLVRSLLDQPRNHHLSREFRIQAHEGGKQNPRLPPSSAHPANSVYTVR
jgi:hypothetical protein